MNTQDTKLLTTKEVADHFRVDSSSVRRWVAKGLLRPAVITPGQHYRFTEASLREFTPPWRSVDQHTGAIANITIDDEEIAKPGE